MAAAAGVELDVARSAAQARPYWNHAPLVIVGGDIAGDLAAAGLPHRDRVLIVTRATADVDTARTRVALGAQAACAPPKPDRDRVLIVTRETADVDTWRTCVALGAQAVWELPEAERILVEELGEAADPPTRAGDVVCVVGGKGGAGATVLAAALAVTASRAGLRTLLIDADPLGGGIDVVLGQEEATGARWPDFVGREGRVGFAALQDALPTFGELTVLSWHRGEPAEIP